THPAERLGALTSTLETLRPAPTVLHLGDLIDIWRTLTPQASPKTRVDAVLNDDNFGPQVQNLRERMGCRFLVGNHDESIVDGAPSWLTESLSEDLQRDGDNVGPYTQRLYFIHGHQFSGIEVLPQELKEFGVRLEHRNPDATHDVSPNPPPGAA